MSNIIKQYRVKVSRLEEMAKEKPAGWLEQELKRGKVENGILTINEVKERTPQKMRGLGDFVAKIAQPIAKTSDKLFHTHISGCSGCQRRQETLNKLVPFAGNETTSSLTI